jgi:2-hydroxychromene-2-carboxylate isomerase
MGGLLRHGGKQRRLPRRSSKINDRQEREYTTIDQFPIRVDLFSGAKNRRKVAGTGALQQATGTSSEHRTLGELISLAKRRDARAAAAATPSRARVTFFFDLASPWTYLGAERVDRRFVAVRWQPALGDTLRAAPEAADEREAVERRAADLRMPLVWPEAWPASGYSAMRVAALATERALAAAFVLAASRLAFCGGYDIDDPEVLAEAAAAAGLGLDECLQAAGDRARDRAPEQAALHLLRRGADALPALAVGHALYCGEHRLAEAATAAGYRTPSTPSARGLG